MQVLGASTGDVGTKQGTLEREACRVGALGSFMLGYTESFGCVQHEQAVTAVPAVV